MTAAMPPGVIAGAVAAVRAHLRLEDDGEAAVLATLCASALALAEAFCGVALVRRTFEESIARGGGWRRLGAVPVAAIEAVVTVPGGEPLPVERYAIDIDAGGEGWVRVAGAAGERATVRYVAGSAAAWDELPAPVAQGVVALVAHLFANRDGDREPPAAVAALWRPYRRLRLGMGARS